MPNTGLRFLPLVAIMLVSWLASVRAEDSDWIHRAWTTEDGLPDNSITGVAQSPDGFIWVATKGGLMRFDGIEFTPMPLQRFPEVPSRAVRAMSMDKRGNLWLGMERGPLIRLGRNDSRYFTEKDGIFPQRLLSSIEDQEGGMFFAFTGGVCRVFHDQVTRLIVDAGGQGNGPMRLALDVGGRVWLCTAGEVKVLEEGEHFVTKMSFSDKALCVAGSARDGIWVAANSSLMWLPSGGEAEVSANLPPESVVTTMHEARDGALWVGTTSHGLFRVLDGKVEFVPTSHHGVDALCEDREGNLWAGTSGRGLNLIRRRAIELIGRAEGLPFDSVQSICQDKSGSIWATDREGMLARWTSAGWQLMDESAGWTGGRATCVAAALPGGVWIGTAEGEVHAFQDGKEQKRAGIPRKGKNSVRSILVARNGDLWVGTDFPFRLWRVRGGVARTLDSEEALGAIRAMAEGADGTLWIGTADGKLLRVAGDKLVTESAITENQPLSVRALHATEDGSLWIGYAGDGLGLLRGRRYARITKEQGLHDDYISQILSDARGSLWLAGNRGISQVRVDDLLEVADQLEVPGGAAKQVRSRVFGRNDGLPSLQPNRDFYPNCLRSTDDRLWFSMRESLVAIRPEVVPESQRPPPVVLERVTLEDKVIARYQARSTRPVDGPDLSIPEPALRIPSDHGKLTLDFSALGFISPENVRYRYRMEKLEERWSEPSTTRSVSYSHLPPGNYRFRVVACNEAGVWNTTGAELGINVIPFFWETWWFRLAAVVATVASAAGVVFLGLRRRHRTQLRQIAARQELELERSRIARDLHDDLGATLMRINLLSLPAGDADAPPPGEALSHIQTAVRQSMRAMDEVVWTVNPVHDSFEALADYFSNYAQGLLRIAGIRCRLDVPFELPQVDLSAQLRHNLFLAFKEALNNVVKHAHATEVRISLALRPGGFTLRVEDDGAGDASKGEDDAIRPGSGNGLANMRSRMAEIGGDCEVNWLPDGGCAVEFTVPIQPVP